MTLRLHLKDPKQSFATRRFWIVERKPVAATFQDPLRQMLDSRFLIPSFGKKVVPSKRAEFEKRKLTATRMQFSLIRAPSSPGKNFKGVDAKWRDFYVLLRLLSKTLSIIFVGASLNVEQRFFKLHWHVFPADSEVEDWPDYIDGGYWGYSGWVSALILGLYALCVDPKVAHNRGWSFGSRWRGDSLM